MAHGTDGYQASNIAATTAGFNLFGGRYQIAAVATWGGGTVKLQQLLPDGSSWFDVANSSLTANGTTGTLELPPGNYRINVVTATAVYAFVTRIPTM